MRGKTILRLVFLAAAVAVAVGQCVAADPVRVTRTVGVTQDGTYYGFNLNQLDKPLARHLIEPGIYAVDDGWRGKLDSTNFITTGGKIVAQFWWSKNRPYSNWRIWSVTGEPIAVWKMAEEGREGAMVIMADGFPGLFSLYSMNQPGPFNAVIWEGDKWVAVPPQGVPADSLARFEKAQKTLAEIDAALAVLVPAMKADVAARAIRKGKTAATRPASTTKGYDMLLAICGVKK